MNQRNPHDNRDNLHRYRAGVEPQGRHDTALRGMGGSGYSYPDEGQHGGAGRPRHNRQGDGPYEDSGEYYGDARYGGTRDPLSTSSVGWGGEGGGFAGYTSSRDRDATPLGGGVLSGDRMPRGIPDEARTDVRADYRGRGPRSYRRSDARIYEDVCERLAADPQLDADDITVEVSDRVVTLSGTVPERWMKHRAEDLSDSCRHVQDVQNDIRVVRSDRNQSQGRAETASPLDIAESTGGPAMMNTDSDTRKGESAHDAAR